MPWRAHHRRAGPARCRDRPRIPRRGCARRDHDELDVADEAAVTDAFGRRGPMSSSIAPPTTTSTRRKTAGAALRVNALGVLALARAAAAGGAAGALRHRFRVRRHRYRPYTEEDQPIRAASTARRSCWAIGSRGMRSRSGLRASRREPVRGSRAGAAARGASAPLFDASSRRGGSGLHRSHRLAKLHGRRGARDARGAGVGRGPGLYHCVNAGAASWAEIAEEAARLLGRPLRMRPLTLESAALNAPRPRYCALPTRSFGCGNRRCRPGRTRLRDIVGESCLP